MVGKKVKKSFAEYEEKTSSGKYKRDCWSDKNKLMPQDVAIQSNKKFWFDCDVCGHEFESMLCDVTRRGRGRWCSYCSNKKLCDKQDCEYCYNKSFASYDKKTKSGKKKIDCWSSKNENTPRDVFIRCGNKYWFDCDVCGHEFDSKLDKVVGHGNWCPYCCIPVQKLCDKGDCQHCHNNSFASYSGTTKSGKKKVDCWSDKNELKPRDVSIKKPRGKFWFDCDVCGHKFDSTLGHVAGDGNWCPYCSSQKMCSSEILCYSCHNKSFASYDGNTLSGKKKVDCWSSKNELTPRDVSIKNSSDKFWFDCDVCGHEFDSRLNNIVSGGNWCPICKNKTELKLLNWLTNFDLIISIEKEYSPEWCSTKYLKYNVKKNSIDKGKYQYRFDFLVTIRGKKNIIIELDGQQHFEQVSNWKSPFCQQIRDKYKEMKAKQKNIPEIGRAHV